MRHPDLLRMRHERARLHLTIKQHETALAAAQDQLARLEAEMLEHGPWLFLPVRRRKPNPIFSHGDLTKMALTVLREAGEPLAIPVIAVRVLAMKGVPLPDARAQRRTRQRLQAMFLRLERRGLTVRVGNGNGARRGLRQY
jgi:hypothetical protein